QLRDGSVPVKGGWRIYSSGPGIYMNQLISNCLGVRHQGRGLVIDPVLPQALDSLQFSFEVLDRPVTFIYHLGAGAARLVINGEDVRDAARVNNKYREGGFYVKASRLNECL